MSRGTHFTANWKHQAFPRLHLVTYLNRGDRGEYDLHRTFILRLIYFLASFQNLKSIHEDTDVFGPAVHLWLRIYKMVFHWRSPSERPHVVTMHTQSLISTYTHRTWSLSPALAEQPASAEVNIHQCLTLAHLQDGCLLAAHITEPHKRQLKRPCYTGSVWGERVERKRERGNERGHEWGRQKKRKKERKYVRENVQHHLSFKTVTDTVSIDLYYNSSKL